MSNFMSVNNVKGDSVLIDSAIHYKKIPDTNLKIYRF